MPAFWVGDSKYAPEADCIKVMGWASNFAQIFDAIDEFYKGKPLPAKLKQLLDANDASIEAQQVLIENQKAELVRINTRFDAELARLKKLWGGATPGTLPPLGELPATAPPTTPKASSSKAH